MAVLRLVTSLILVAAAFGQPSLKLKMNPSGLSFILDQLEQLDFSFDLNDIQITDSNPFLSRVFTTTELQLNGFNFGTITPLQYDEDSFGMNVTGSTAEVLGQHQYLVTQNSTGAATSNSTGELNFVYSLSFTLNFDLILDEGTNTGISITYCNVDVHQPEIRSDHTDNTEAAILALLETDYQAPFQTQLCTIVAPSIQDIINSQIQSVPPQFELLAGILLNTSQYELPEIIAGSVQVKFDGKAFPASNPDIVYPYQRIALPAFDASEKMVQAAVGEYTLQTILHAVVNAGVLNLNVPTDAVQVGIFTLETLLSTVIDGLPDFLKGRSIKLRTHVFEVPILNIREDHVAGTGIVSLFIEAVNANNSTEVVTEMRISVNTTGMVSFVNSSIDINITNIEAGFSARNTANGLSVKINVIEGILGGSGANALILPLINGQLEGGFALPIILGFRFVDIEIDLSENVAQIAFNIEQVTTEGGMAVPAFNIQQGESEEEADESTIM